MYATAQIETRESSSNASRASASMSSSTTIRHVRRWSVFSKKVSRKVFNLSFMSVSNYVEVVGIQSQQITISKHLKNILLSFLREYLSGEWASCLLHS